MTSPDTSVDGADRTSLEGLIGVDRLTEWMDAQPDLPGAGEPLDVKRVSSGASNDIFELHAAVRC